LTERPSYLALLNGISNGERQGYEYFAAWLGCASDPDLKATLTTVATREHEHSLAFAKRIDELGFALEVRDVIDFSKQLEIVRSDCSDYEKAKALGLFDVKESSDEPDVFSGFFKDKTIDIQTGALLGRYIAEERDSGRLIAACAAKLKAKYEPESAAGGNRIDALERKVDAMCEAVDNLTQAIAAQKSANGKAKAKTAS
jgi:hypothetical protein